MASKFSFVAVAAVGIALAGGVAWWLQSRPQLPNPIKGAEGSAARPAGGAPGAPRVVGVEVARVAVQALRDDAQSVGSLRARNSVMLRPELVGRITALNFKDGGPVRKGQVLVQFDNQLQQAEVQQMQAQLAIAQANYQRTQELVAEKFLAQQTLDTSAANLKVAQAQLALAQARLGRMAVRAPFDGTAGIRLVNVGDYVKDGTDLVALEDARQMLVDYRLPERYGGMVKSGQRVELTLDALPGRSFRAAVEAIDPLLDTTGRSVGVRALLAVPERAPLRTGMSARVTTVFSINEAALVVPEEALVPQGGKQFVIQLVAPPAGTTLPADSQFVSQRQEVKLGVRRAGRVEVVAGLAAGDTVVVAGQQRLQKDGSPVRIVALGKPAGKAASGSAPAAPASR
ncbi:efflux RND transporter periplasmic adaptor subunit [Rhodoferax sp.]|uniref:efflux RND transporter periplasmic adaptor subunit n=1 Tax=Rhodoferax sp. TaxID=50421 RepID=UPI002730CCA7|nr:efflux RND transporter periplasmic adaptor subunit [Rhodoferax sp.]MDP2441325.1 efflux RND transporter periplasmic adaptor subunit [Rhodoferax sp.]MDZ4207186.1 efflux RND transporter periplasmic adaptor subunit [Rhodoferax sp.]